MIDQLIKTTLEGAGDSDPHLISLFAIALNIKAGRILELGVRDGASTLPLLLAASYTNGMLVSVDCGPTPFIPPSHLVNRWIFQQWCAANGKRFDLIFVDDCHAYGHVKKELELIDRISDKRTVILMHDLMAPWCEPEYTPQDKWIGEWDQGGPQRAVRELDKARWEWAIIPVSNGLTLLRKTQ